MTDLVEKLYREQTLSKSELIELINCDEAAAKRLCSLAEKVRRENYGYDIYVRGLIEFSNYCKQDCNYCGIRKSNQNCERYRLSLSEIMECCEDGYA